MPCRLLTLCEGLGGQIIDRLSIYNDKLYSIDLTFCLLWLITLSKNFPLANGMLYWLATCKRSDDPPPLFRKQFSHWRWRRGTVVDPKVLSKVPSYRDAWHNPLTDKKKLHINLYTTCLIDGSDETKPEFRIYILSFAGENFLNVMHGRTDLNIDILERCIRFLQFSKTESLHSLSSWSRHYAWRKIAKAPKQKGYIPLVSGL